MRGGKGRVLVQYRRRVTAGKAEQLEVLDKVRDLQFGQAMLLCTEELPRAAKAKVLLGDPEAVVGLFQHRQPLPGDRVFRRGDQDARGVRLRPADPPAELV